MTMGSKLGRALVVGLQVNTMDGFFYQSTIDHISTQYHNVLHYLHMIFRST